jgi:hypothetical protein
MLEKANFERFKIEYDKDPNFDGLGSLREYQNRKQSSVRTVCTDVSACSISRQSMLDNKKSLERHSSMPTDLSKHNSLSRQQFEQSLSHMLEVEQEAATKKRAFGIKCGWMCKEGRIFKSWNQRWFVLNKGVLRYYKNSLENFPYGQGLKGEISLGDYCTVPVTDTRFELRSLLERGKHYLLETNDEEECDEWQEMINFQILYWHTEQCSALQYEDVAMEPQPTADDKLHYFQKRMVSLHRRQSESNIAEVEEIMKHTASTDELTAYELLQVNVSCPLVEFLVDKPLTLPAGSVLFTAGLGAVAPDWLPAGGTIPESKNKQDTSNDIITTPAPRPSFLANTAPIPGCPMLLQTSEHMKVQFRTNKVQIELQFPKMLRFISLHLEDRQLFLHSLAMISAIQSKTLATRVNDLAKAMLAFISTYLLLPNLNIFMNLAMTLASVDSTDTDTYTDADAAEEADDDISLSLATPYSCKTDCIKLYLKLNVNDVIADVLHLKELLLHCISAVAAEALHSTTNSEGK